MLNSVNAGWNVIDTAANYRGGRAEASIGEAVQALRRWQFFGVLGVFLGL